MYPTTPPPGVPIGDPTDVVGRRIGAYAIDLLLAAIVVAFVVLPAYNARVQTLPASEFRCAGVDIDEEGESLEFDDRRTLSGGLCLEAGDDITYVDDEGTNELAGYFYGAFGAMGIANLVLLQGLTGGSVGKLLVGLRVVRRDGRTAHVGWAALRWLVLIIDAACCFLPGAVLVFSTKGHRRLGDMAAGTFVVARSSVGSPVVVPGMHTPAAGTWAPPPDAGAWPQAAAPGPSAPPSDRGPVWDDARNTYLQYDDARGAWMEWDADGSRWRPIDGGPS